MIVITAIHAEIGNHLCHIQQTILPIACGIAHHTVNAAVIFKVTLPIGVDHAVFQKFRRFGTVDIIFLIGNDPEYPAIEIGVDIDAGSKQFFYWLFIPLTDRPVGVGILSTLYHMQCHEA